MKSRNVNTSGLSAEQSCLALEYIGTELDAAVLVAHATALMQQLKVVMERVDESLAVAQRAEEAFKASVPDWESRLSGSRPL